MTDREALAPALDKMEVLAGHVFSFDEELRMVVAAARERLAQLPERCHDHWHLVATPRPESCPSCDDTGRVYPPALVERIARAVFNAEFAEISWETVKAEYAEDGADFEGDHKFYYRAAIAVLEALLETL